MLNRIFVDMQKRMVPIKNICRTSTTTATGAFLPKPERESFGSLKIFLAVVPGLLIGAAISKHMATFLEENELFVRSDDDDDDD